ncbi:MAG: helix-turn-helix domain-containing protein [Parachlamydiaceae bacterium]
MTSEVHIEDMPRMLLEMMIDLREMKNQITAMTEQKAKSEQVVFTVGEAAKEMRSSQQWIREKCNDGTIPSHRVGSYLRIAKDDLDRYKASNVGAKAAAKLAEMSKARRVKQAAA